MTDLRMFEMFYQFESRASWSITIFDIYPTIHGKSVLKCLKNISHLSLWEIPLKEYCRHTKTKHLTSLEVDWDEEFTHFWRKLTGRISNIEFRVFTWNFLEPNSFPIMILNHFIVLWHIWMHVDPKLVLVVILVSEFVIGRDILTFVECATSIGVLLERLNRSLRTQLTCLNKSTFLKWLNIHIIGKVFFN